MRRVQVVSATVGILVLMMAAYALGAHQALRPSTAYAADDCQNFTQTGHQVCGAFLQYWTANGGLAQQGYPISDPMMEMSATDGKTYQVQYFERAVFEMHPELPAGSNVLLSLLGSEKYRAKYGGKTPSGTPSMATGTATPIIVANNAATRTTVSAATPAPAANRVTGTTLAITYNGIKDPAPTDNFNKPDNATNRCVAIDLTFENISSSPVSYNPAYAGLRTSDDRTYDRTYSCSNITPVRSASMINTGEKVRTYMLFEIPKGIAVSSSIYSDFGDNVITVKIG